MRLIYALERLIYPLLRINWLKYFKLKNKNARFVVFSSLKTNKKFKSEIFAWELGFIKELILQSIPFNYKKSEHGLKDKIIFWSPHTYFFEKIKFNNYPITLSFFAKQFENQNNKIFLDSNEILMLENKFYMHQQFEKHGIKTPKTWLFKRQKDINIGELKFPLLFKENHSSSALGIHLIRTKEDLKQFKFDNDIVLQELIDIRRDMRVTIIGDSVVSSYWRINSSDRWMPTSTKNGSTVEFLKKIPPNLEKYILEIIKKLNMDICGIDIVFENDDITKKPLVLEVSPRFSQNPNFDTSKVDFDYGTYKKKSFMKKSFRYMQTEVHMNYAQKYVKYIINKKLKDKDSKNIK